MSWTPEQRARARARAKLERESEMVVGRRLCRQCETVQDAGTFVRVARFLVCQLCASKPAPPDPSVIANPRLCVLCAGMPDRVGLGKTCKRCGTVGQADQYRSDEILTSSAGWV